MQKDEQQHTQGNIPSPFTAEDRFKRASGQTKQNPSFHGLPIERLRRRKQLVQNGVTWRMSIDQIKRYCSIMGEKLANRTVYDYVNRTKQPKRYDKTGRDQTHHDYMTFECFLKICDGFKKLGAEPAAIRFNQSPGEKAGFRFDFKFRIGKYLFYGEVQLSDLAGTNWRRKHKGYVRWYERNTFPFRVLMVIDQKRDMSTVRAHAREVLQDHPNLNLYLYTTLNDLQASDNPVLEPIWRDAKGIKTALASS